MWDFWKRTVTANTMGKTATVRCPRCSGIEAVPVVNIKSYAIGNGGEVVEKTIGYRVACQRCECVYSVVPTGVFHHSARSLPLTPEAPRHVEQDPDEPPISMPMRPSPRRRPAG